MPLERQNFSRLHLAAALEEPADGLDDLLGPPQMRPGDLHERYPHPVPEGFLRATRARGIPASLAVSVTCERQLAIRDITGCLPATVVRQLDLAARATRSSKPLSELAADYARTLVAAISGPLESEPTQGPPVVSMRLASRLRNTGTGVELLSSDIEIALWWELAATMSGATMTEWALHLAMCALYSSPAVANPSAASSTAR